MSDDPELEPSERSAIVASGGICVPMSMSEVGTPAGGWPESMQSYMWDLMTRPTQGEAICQIVGSLEAGSLKARLAVEWADEIGQPDSWSVSASLPVFSASSGGVQYVTPPGLTVGADGSVSGYIATWPKPRHRHLRHRWASLRLTVGDWISGARAAQRRARPDTEDEDGDW